MLCAAYLGVSNKMDKGMEENLSPYQTPKSDLLSEIDDKYKVVPAWAWGHRDGCGRQSSELTFNDIICQVGRMKTVALLLAVAVLHMQQHRAATQQIIPFTLINSQSIRSNIITLRCRNSDDIFDPQAMYFLNGTTVHASWYLVATSVYPF